MQSINVNIVPGDFPQILRYSQGDVGREFRINVVDFDIPTGATATIVATKPSGFGFTAAGTVTDNVVSFVTTEDMTDEYGKFPAEVRITNGTTLLGTANFMFIGEKNPHPDGTVDGMQGTIIPELTLLVNEIRESNAKVESMTASAVALPSGSDPTAEYNATDNNLEFGIPVVDLTNYATQEEVDEAITDLRSDLEAELDTKADAIIETASGSIASFDDGGDDLPMKSLKVEIVPKQSGSGDPSPDNVRPIEGWSGVNVSHSGADQTNPTVYLIEFKDENGDPVTVYGGTLDVVSGKLVIDKAMANLGAMDWASRSSADRHIFRTLVNGLNPAIAYPPTGQIVTTAICEQYTAMGYGPISASDNYKFAIGIQEDPLLVIINFDYSTAEDFKTAMNGVKLVYPLATPIEIDLTPTEIRTLKGVNNVWADTGDTEVEYRADTTLAFEKLKNAIVSLGGNI